LLNELRGPPLVTIDVGSLRFEPPVPIGKFQSTIEAIALKPSCIQVFVGMDMVKQLTYSKYSIIFLGFWPLNLFLEYLFNQGNPPESEDCLYVNVFTPQNQFEPPKPVMV
jgi:carboxylesterase type B